MNTLESLNERLAFIRWFYFNASQPFTKIQGRSIPLDEGVDDSSRHDEWIAATTGVEVLGQCGLVLLAKAIQDYLRESVNCLGLVGKKKSKESWLDFYCRLLEANTDFRWMNCPVPLERIEQILLCRNDFIHDPAINGFQPRQSRQHFAKYRSSPFIDPLDVAVRTAMTTLSKMEVEESAALTVKRHELMRAIEDVKKFCGFVEGHTANVVQEEGLAK